MKRREIQNHENDAQADAERAGHDELKKKYSQLQAANRLASEKKDK